MPKIAILASTKATDMQAVIDAIEKKELDAEISIVISNKQDAYALERAKDHNVKAIFLDPKEFKEIEDKEQRREAFDKRVSEEIDQYTIDIILCIGYMRILSPLFVQKYRNKIINIHPSLLPAFAGGFNLNVHEEVLNSGVKKTGCTLHFIDETVDGGPIIMQQAVEIEETETPETLKAKVQQAEGEIIVKALKLFSEGKISVIDNKVQIQ